MALVHEFEKTGNWLFKRRSWLPVILVISGVAVMYYVNRLSILFDLRKEMIFLAVSLLGELIRVLTVGFAPGNTSGRNTASGQIADEINETGIYSIVRHPLYVGNYLMWLGPSLFLRSVWFTIVFTLVYWLYYERIMFAEEQFLRRKFGDMYDTWSGKVRAVLPSFKNYAPPRLSFSLRTVLRREYNSFVNIFLIFFALDFVRNYIVTGRILITPLWGWLFGGAVVIWLVLRSIHRYTSWFTVEGR
ncbi:MAG TPA: isoprenylcysteine carboxylmethyltransferase family protein [Bacteroidales bacterium]|nr:isoprenylcysteine carboxylmethyltransferase family protein [Bacteroidales bacterium]